MNGCYACVPNQLNVTKTVNLVTTERVAWRVWTMVAKEIGAPTTDVIPKAQVEQTTE